MVITKSVKFKKGTYFINDKDYSDSAVLVIEGNNMVVDFNQSVLVGSGTDQKPNSFHGMAIKITGGHNITIKNLSARGYKVAVYAMNTEGLKIDHCDFSYNFRAHLNSTPEREDLSDWLSNHDNEHDQWLRYGAGIYLRNCSSAVVSNVKVTNGENGLMMTECHNAIIYNNEFSFNSGVGLGMYRCSNNKVLYNKIDFNIRGYSDGVYSRGQDSAGILVYEQSNNNVFYKNSATHGGDGFFLWAGQTTMDKGLGGCDDNILKDNDFSYAAANGVEATFSRNQIVHNRIFGCENGVWAGYAHDSRITQNQFRFNHTGINIEHGRKNILDHNLFYKDGVAIRLSAGQEDTTGWKYPQIADTRSRNYLIAGNSFNNDSIVYQLSNTEKLKIFDNRETNCLYSFKSDSEVAKLDTAADPDLDVLLSDEMKLDLPEIKSPSDPFKGSGRLKGRDHIIITEWGPYNFGYPYIQNMRPADTTGDLEFDVWGTEGGTWKILNTRGLAIKEDSMQTYPGKIRARKTASVGDDIEIDLAYSGPGFTDALGKTIANPKHYVFSYHKFFFPIPFEVNWYLAGEKDSLDEADSLGIANKKPFKTERVDQLHYAWWGGADAAHQQVRRFLTIARGAAFFPAGLYELSLSWSDCIRVYVDGKLIIHEPCQSKAMAEETTNRRIQLQLGGRHQFLVEHLKTGSFSSFSLDLNRLN